MYHIGLYISIAMPYAYTKAARLKCDFIGFFPLLSTLSHTNSKSSILILYVGCSQKFLDKSLKMCEH